MTKEEVNKLPDFALEREIINGHTQSHRNGNSNSFVSYIRPTRWKEVAVSDDIEALRKCGQKGDRIVNRKLFEVIEVLNGWGSAGE